MFSIRYYTSVIIIERTSNKTLTVLGIFVLITLLTAVSYHPESILAKQNGTTCNDKDNNNYDVCSHTNSGSSKAHTGNDNMKTKHDDDNNKQSNSDRRNSVPFELPFP